MTQLVELQKHVAALARENVKVYAITYDPQESLAAFAQRHGITYQLLADEGSKVIERFGILNTLIAPDDPAKNPMSGQRFYGIPFPGTYITDESGVVVEKHFFQHYEQRVSAGTILDRAIGKVLIHDEAPQQEAREQSATITAFLADSELRRDVTSTLYVRIAMDAGFHVYANPLPEGFVATTVQVGPVEGLAVGEAVYPATHPREFPELEVTLPVYESTAIVAVPVTAEAELFRGTDKPPTLKIPVEVSYQACSETVCYRPRTVELVVEAPLAGLVLPDPRK
jgi:peroxiredoxin